jgi:bifunctional enzyme CysN/CysC
MTNQNATDADEQTRLGAQPLRLPVQSVNQPSADVRACSGTLVAGRVRTGDTIRIQPSGRITRVLRVATGGQDVPEATLGQLATITLEGDLPLSPGDLIVPANEPADVADQFEATLEWTGAQPLLPGRSYAMKTITQTPTATITRLKYRLDPATSQRSPAPKLERNQTGVCNVQLDRPIAFDPHRVNRHTGSFTFVDRSNGEVVGTGKLHFALRRAQNVQWQALDVDKTARAALKSQKPCVLWYTGLSGAGKSTIANLVEKKLHSLKRHTYLLDGDNVRHGLNRDLGFTDADRVENIRRIGEVAKLMVDAGLIVSTAFISPFRAERDMARALLAEGEFIEVFVDTPLGVAEERDPKGLYKKARRGDLKNFTGIDSPYEAPQNPELRVDTTTVSPEDAAEMIVSYLRGRGVLNPGSPH